MSSNIALLSMVLMMIMVLLQTNLELKRSKIQSRYFKKASTTNKQFPQKTVSDVVWCSSNRIGYTTVIKNQSYMKDQPNEDKPWRIYIERHVMKESYLSLALDLCFFELHLVFDSRITEFFTSVAYQPSVFCHLKKSRTNITHMLFSL